MGTGDRNRADKVAVEAMRKVMDSVPMQGTIVIGEGERDQAPMLYICEKVGMRVDSEGGLPEVDIAGTLWRGQTCVPPVHLAPLQCWPAPSEPAS